MRLILSWQTPLFFHNVALRYREWRGKRHEMHVIDEMLNAGWTEER